MRLATDARHRDPAPRTAGWWSKAVAVSLIATVVGTLAGAALTLPIVNASAVELDRFARFLVMLPGVVIGSVMAGVLAGLVMGHQSKGLVAPALASLASGLILYVPVLVGLWLDAAWVTGLGWGADVVAWVVQAAAILLALYLGRGRTGRT